MATRNFSQVDVFSSEPYLGNPVAVVLDAQGLSDVEMQRLARWTNLSETTFVLPPTDSAADYKLRIFTPVGELPFAGHPTLGSAHAWVENGGVAKNPGSIVQECGAGLVTLKMDQQANAQPAFAFRAPPTRKSGPLEPDVVCEAAAALGIDESEIVDHQHVDNGPGWVCVELESAERVLAMKPQFRADTQLKLGLLGKYPDGSDAAYELRAFVPEFGVQEDPVTGSLNASVAQWLFRTGKATDDYLATQGAALGRAGRISLKQDETGEVWVGGATVTCIQGQIEI